MIRGGRGILVLVAATLGAPGPALAQAPIPPAPAPSVLEREILESRTMVRRIVVEGVRAIPEAAVREVAQRFEGRSLDEGELRDIERRLTQLYLDRGYATSGVVLRRLPSDGVATYAAVEGTIDQVRFVEQPRYGSAAWLASLLVPDAKAPARLEDLQERMSALRDSGIVERINAELVPLPQVGSSELRITVEEPHPWDVELRYDNYHSPAVGAKRPSVIFTHRNVTGWGDRVLARVGRSEGLHDARVDYAVPIPRSRWRLGAHYERSDSLAIDPPEFRALDITSYSYTAGGEIGYEWISRPALSFSTRAGVEKRESESRLLGMPFSFIAGFPDAISKVDVARVAAQLNASRTDQAAFLRFQASRGRTNVAAGAGVNAPERDFRSFALQGQYALRLAEWGLQALARFDGQYSGDTLLPIEKKAIGGIETVRGFRENLLLGDRAAAATLELRAPAWRWEESARLVVSTFADVGWARDVVQRDDGLPRRIASIGVGLALVLPAGFAVRVDYARPNVRWLTERRDSQDRGLHFLVSWRPTALLP